MRLKIRNLGAIEKAEIDLSKDLIVFCGQNNTSKTYVAYCIYALNRIGYSGFTFTKIKLFDELTDKKLPFNLSFNLFEKILSHKEEIKDIIKKKFKGAIRSIFGLSKEDEQNIFPNFELTVDFDDIYIKKVLQKELSVALNFGDELKIKLNKPRGNMNLICTCEALVEDKKIIENSDFIKYVIAEEIFIKILFNNAYIAPVERNSIYTFSKELSLKRNELVDELLKLKESKNIKKKNNDPFTFIERRAMRYPLPIRDGLSVAEDLVTLKKFDSLFESFATKLENDILGGKIVINSAGDVQFKPKKSKSPKLPIHITGSIIKSLSSLVFYFRHLAKDGDFIIIDEPELNLHPDNQILLIRIIAKIVNAGFKVLINTHSDYIIKELNNLIALSQDTAAIKTLRNEYGYDEDELIKSSRVKAYLFDYKKGKSKCSVGEIPIEKDGFDVKTIDTVIKSLDERVENLYFALLNNEN